MRSPSKRSSRPASSRPKRRRQQPFDTLLASASAEHGAQIAKQCTICHNLQEGQGPKIGPDLYGVVGRPVASVASFKYSAALKAKGGTWTFDALNKWLTDPRADVPGTAMTFAGIANEKQRADVIAYLNTLSASPAAAADREKRGRPRRQSGTQRVGQRRSRPRPPPAQPNAPAPAPKAQ